MVYKILIVVAVLVAVFVIVVALRPAEFRLARSAAMAAPAAAVFEQVNNLQNWRGWSPWEGIDPELKRTYEGPAAGTAAVYEWSGNNKVGAGRMTITESRPSELIRIKLEFLRPFAATNTSEFTFAPQGDGQTQVTWSMVGRNNFMAKAFCMFVNMDKLVGRDFEKGLAQMKSIVEAAPAPVPLPAHA